MTEIQDAMRMMSRGQLLALADHAKGVLTFATDAGNGTLALREKPRDRGWEALQKLTLDAAIEELRARDRLASETYDAMRVL